MASRKHHLWSRYRITLEDYDRLLAEQNFQCAICATPASAERHLCVDHCHVSGEVRGLLCPPCNRAIGKLLDSPEVVQRAADYLKKHVRK